MKKYKNIAIIVLVLVVAWLIREKINASQYEKRVEKNLTAQKDEISSYKLKNGQQVATIKSLEVSQNELKKQLWVKDDSLSLMIKEFKNVKAAVVVDTKVVIDSVPVPYEVPVPCEFYREFTFNDPNYSFRGVSSHLGITLKDLQIPNTMRLVLGEKRNFFKTTITADVTNSNLLIQTTGITSQVTTVPIKRFGVSVFVGYDITLQPTVGVGVSYTPFFF